MREPPTFSGDSFEYPAFVTAFDSIIAANVAADKDRLFYLENYTSGKANEAIRGFLATNSDTAYAEARKLLDQRFGNPVIVAENFKTKLRNWRHISDGDSKSLQEFSDFLVRCEESMKVMRSRAELDSTQMLMSLSAKLPSYIGIKWCRFAHEQQSKKHKQVGFADFVQFVKLEAELANDPVFSPDVLKKERRKTIPRESGVEQQRRPFRSVNKSSHTFATTGVTSKPGDNRLPAVSQNQNLLCAMCKGKHPLWRCEEFAKATADDRHKLVKTKRLCFRCLKSNHISSDCASKFACKDCGKSSHNTLLHGATVAPKLAKNENKQSEEQRQIQQLPQNVDSAQSKATSVVHSSASDVSTTSCKIIPVILYHKNKQGTEVKTYALLDDASDTTFVTNSITEKLGIQGVKTSLNLSTMHGQQTIPVARVDGLVAERLDRHVKVKLPKAYAKDSIPARRDQIPTPDIAEKWVHLRKIKDKIFERDAHSCKQLDS